MTLNNDSPADKEKLLQHAEAGDADSQYLLSLKYLEPDILNSEQALKWLEIAAAAGHAQAIFKLAELYERGGIVKQNVRTAAAKYRQAADAGLVEAYMMVAKMHLLGKGIMQDPDEAVEWYRKAAEKGNAEAQYNIGEMHRVGRILPKDAAEAARWLQKAAEQNHLEAQVRLLQINE
jgi:TPR repeat protein